MHWCWHIYKSKHYLQKICPASTRTPARSTNTTRTNRDQSSAGRLQDRPKTTSKQRTLHPTTTMTTQHLWSPFIWHTVACFPVLPSLFKHHVLLWLVTFIVCSSSPWPERICRKIFTYAAAIELLRRPPILYPQMKKLEVFCHHWWMLTGDRLEMEWDAGVGGGLIDPQ